MSAFGPAADRMVCVCCQNFGELPHPAGDLTFVPLEVVVQMCDECIDAAFLGGGQRLHPHPFIHATRPIGREPVDSVRSVADGSRDE